MENWGQQCKHLTDQYKVRGHEMLLAILFYNLIETRGELKDMGAGQKQICRFCRIISQNIVPHINIFSYSQCTKLFKGFLSTLEILWTLYEKRNSVWNILMSFRWDQFILFKMYY